jgi:hypothetical protein
MYDVMKWYFDHLHRHMDIVNEIWSAGLHQRQSCFGERQYENHKDRFPLLQQRFSGHSRFR